MRKLMMASIASLIGRRDATCSEAGKLGAEVRHNRERAAIRARCDKMRKDMGLAKAEWPE